MLNILFWNLKQNSIEDYIVKCIAENDVDIAAFAEYKGVDFRIIEKNLGNQYQHIGDSEKDGKVTLIAKKTHMFKASQPQERYTIYNLKTVMKEYILSVVHLEDRKNYNTTDRLRTIQSLVNDIQQFEETYQCNNTIVIGDLNSNPYDDELLSVHGFNAVLFGSIIRKNEIREFENKYYKRFYNPILHYISDKTGMCGSFYYGKESNTPYWHCLDQVLVRKNLVDCISNIQYLKNIETTSLVKNVCPNKTISDHLPLIVTFLEVENEV